MKYILVGKIHSAQGIKGELFVSIFSEEATWADQWQTLFLSEENGTEPTRNLKIQKARPHQKKKRWGFAVRLEGVADRNRAEELVKHLVYVPESFLISGEGEGIFLREVLGFRVLDKQRGEVGEVVGFAGNSMQDIVVIKNDQGEFEVPFVEPIHVETDMENKILHMDIPQGLVAGEEL